MNTLVAGFLDTGQAELVRSFAAIASRLLSGSVDATLQRIVDRAVDTLDGCDWAGITLADGNDLRTVAITDPVVEEADRAQYRLGHGPCLEALRSSRMVVVQDLLRDGRWQPFAEEVLPLGISGALSYQLNDNGRALGMLNLYSGSADAFRPLTQEAGVILAAHAAVAIVEAREAQANRQKVVDLRRALATRDVIGQAKGILMAREGVSAEEAFAMLKRASQALNVKLGDVAGRVVDNMERQVR